MSRQTPRLVALALIVAGAGCVDDRAPSTPGTTGTTTVGGDGDGDGDGGPGDTDAGFEFGLTGVVCVVTDLRFPTACAATGAGGVSVRERGSQTGVATRSNGAFALPLARKTEAEIEIGFGNQSLHPSVVRVPLGTDGASGVLLPVAGGEAWDDLVTTLITAEPDGTAAIAVYLVRGDDVESGAEVIAPPQTTTAPFYDDGAALTWSQVGLTGAAGAAMLFGVPAIAPDATVTIVGFGGAPVVNVTVPITEDATTFALVDIAP